MDRKTERSVDFTIGIMHKYHDPNVNLALIKVLDTFSGGDNSSFVAFLSLIRDMDSQAASGDKSAKAILKILMDFSRLIEVSTRHTSPKPE